MSHITLVRHGQANSQAKDEESYDKLSDLGHKQAAWLGEWLSESETFHNRLYTGTLRRHIETADQMKTGLTPTRDSRLNEMEYFTLSTLFEEQHGFVAPDDQAGFAKHLPLLFEYWRDDKIEGVPESYADFENRLRDVVSDIAAGDGPALVVTSGGVIGMIMAQAMGLDLATHARVTLAVFQTSMHRLHPIGGHWAPVMFNAMPHMETAERRLLQTHF